MGDEILREGRLVIFQETALLVFTYFRYNGRMALYSRLHSGGKQDEA